MISFKEMWSDINSEIDSNCNKGFKIKKKFETGFIIDEEGENVFLTKDDFVNFWCWFLYLKEININEIVNNKNGKYKYILNLMKELPYTKIENEKLILIS